MRNAFYCQSYDICFDIILNEREKKRNHNKRAFQSINELMHINGTLKWFSVEIFEKNQNIFWIKRNVAKRYDDEGL